MKMTRRRLISATMLLSAAIVAARAPADELRNVQVGEEAPQFSMPALDGSTISSAKLQGKTVILVFLAAQQRSSEQAAVAADGVFRDLHHDDLELVFVTADTAHAAYFRAQRDATNVHAPLGLDFERELYGALGLIVLPTSVIIDRDWKLDHVISAYKSDYEHVLSVRARQALGLIDEDRAERELEQDRFRHDRPADRVARHLAAARLLRRNGLMHDAENELKAALEIDPEDAGARLDLASLYLATDRVEEADRIVTQVLERESSHRRAKLLKGVALYHLDRLDEAEKILTNALLLNPDPVQTHYYLGRIYEKKGEAAKAARHYREGLVRVLEERPL
ncbi:MAG: tetratricopeptide repeat protein [Planctomycetota bacterium]|nr:tetratricopeptide repeat protein [Planctomycetota bacterium]